MSINNEGSNNLVKFLGTQINSTGKLLNLANVEQLLAQINIKGTVGNSSESMSGLTEASLNMLVEKLKILQVVLGPYARFTLEVRKKDPSALLILSAMNDLSTFNKQSVLDVAKTQNLILNKEQLIILDIVEKQQERQANLNEFESLMQPQNVLDQNINQFIMLMDILTTQIPETANIDNIANPEEFVTNLYSRQINALAKSTLLLVTFALQGLNIEHEKEEPLLKRLMSWLSIKNLKFRADYLITREKFIDTYSRLGLVDPLMPYICAHIALLNLIKLNNLFKIRNKLTELNSNTALFSSKMHGILSERDKFRDELIAKLSNTQAELDSYSKLNPMYYLTLYKKGPLSEAAEKLAILDQETENTAETVLLHVQSVTSQIDILKGQNYNLSILQQNATKYLSGYLTERMRGIVENQTKANNFED